MAGMILEGWQRVLADLGVVGADKGQGGKYLILPPGHEAVEPQGYYVVPSPSRVVLGGVRLLGEDKEKAIHELIPGFKTYAWSPTGAGTPMAVRRAGDTKWSQMPPHGMAYWESLNDFIQREPVMERDRLILAQLRFLGIEKGKPFKPDARQRKILAEGAEVGEAMAKANTSDKRVEPPFWPNTHWKHALVVAVDQRAPDYDQLDERAAWFYEAVVISKGMLTQTPGVGQRYIAAYKDSNGEWLNGSNTYKLHVPPNPPVKQFWSVTYYDEGTRRWPQRHKAGRIFPRARKTSSKTATGRSTSISDPRRRRGTRPTGFKRIQARAGSPTSASTGQPSRSSTSPGRCPTLKGSADRRAKGASS
jgi:hypothetical protein